MPQGASDLPAIAVPPSHPSPPQDPPGLSVLAAKLLALATSASAALAYEGYLICVDVAARMTLCIPPWLLRSIRPKPPTPRAESISARRTDARNSNLRPWLPDDDVQSYSWSSFTGSIVARRGGARTPRVPGPPARSCAAADAAGATWSPDGLERLETTRRLGYRPQSRAPQALCWT